MLVIAIVDIVAAAAVVGRYSFDCNNCIELSVVRKQLSNGQALSEGKADCNVQKCVRFCSVSS